MKFLIAPLLVLALAACSAKAVSESTSRDNQESNAGAMVVTANPHATKAGAEILQAGGSAVDAAIAIEAVLSLVEPQSSGLAGGAFMVFYNAETGEVTAYDGRETAPASASADMFLKQDGESIGYFNAKHSGLSTGIPGVMDMFAMAHKDHGRLAWGQHFDYASKLATEGFAVSPRLNYMIERFGKYLPKTEAEGPTEAYEYFHENGAPLAVGSILRNPDYADALTLMAKNPRALYEGELADAMITEVARMPRGAVITQQDLNDFRARKSQALCVPFKGDKSLCGPPPPSSWLGMSSMVRLLGAEGAASQQGASDPENWAKFAMAQRVAYADRDQYVADPAFVNVPVNGLTNEQFIQKRAELIKLDQASQPINAGDPWAYETQREVAYGEDATIDHAGTTHFVVVDKDGNVVSMTASVESIFGSARMVGGMFLNNQLTDFSFKSKDAEGKAIANRVEAGKRPRSSMSPTIVLDENGKFLMATGSPGGNSILAYTAKTIVGVFDWGLTPQQAVELPNMVARGDKVRIEKDRAAPELIQSLKDYGFNVKESAGENSGLSVVLKHPDGSLEGGVDPRREGVIELIKAQ